MFCVLMGTQAMYYRLFKTKDLKRERCLVKFQKALPHPQFKNRM